MKRMEAVLIIALLACICAVFSSALSSAAERGSPHAPDILAPEAGRDPWVVDARGEEVSFRSFVGRKPLVVVFWATWCPLCRDEVPTLNRLDSDPSISVLAVNVGENEEKVRAFISKYHVNYPVVRDQAWETTSAYRIAGLPACLLLDVGGRVLYRGSSLPGNIDAYLRR